MNFLPSDKFRRFLAWFFIACNLLFALAGTFLVFDTAGDKTMLFLVLAFAVNAGLLIDYTNILRRLEKEQIAREREDIRSQARSRTVMSKAIQDDQILAEEIRRDLRERASEELSIEELRELLQRKENNQNESLHG
jgi:hypothetical protein